LCTALINIQSAKSSNWAEGKQRELEAFFGRLHEYQSIFTENVTTIYNQVRGETN
jgi:hypothetical protein